MRALWLCLGTSVLFLHACGVAVEVRAADPTSERESAAEPTPILEPADDEPSAAGDGAAAFVPAGTFSSVEALCEAQRELVLPLITTANDERRQMYGDASGDVSPSCVRDDVSLAQTRIHLAAPLRELVPIRIETGAMSATFVTVRTDGGWRVVPTPLATEDHDDPGCPSIVRDGMPTAIRLDGRTLVIEDAAGRGVGEEYDQTDDTGAPLHPSFRSETLQRVRTCRIARDAIACGEPIVVHREVSTSGGPSGGVPAHVHAPEPNDVHGT